MGARAVLQRLITINGDTSSDDVNVTQPASEWLDCGNWTDAIVTAHVSFLSTNASDTPALELITVDEKRDAPGEVPDGPAWTVCTFEPIVNGKWYKHLSTFDQDGISSTRMPIDRYLFWLLSIKRGGSGGAFQCTFEIFVTLKNRA